MSSMNFISILTSIALVYPQARYYVQISTHNDYDFSNLFIECSIVKMGILGIMLLAYAVGNFNCVIDLISFQ